MPGYERTAYMDFLLQNREREVVSVLTGMRGAGKTSLLAQYVSRLQAEGVPENRIFFADMSDPEARRFFPEEKLFRKIMRRFAGRKKRGSSSTKRRSSPDSSASRTGSSASPIWRSAWPVPASPRNYRN